MAGLGVGLILMICGFMVVAGGYFMMWQSPNGQSSLQLAFQHTGAIGIILIYLNMSDQ